MQKIVKSPIRASLCACLPLLLLVILGCSSLVSRRVPQDSRRRAPQPRQSEGFGYFLPLGKVHIVATLNVTLTTNFGIRTETLGGGHSVTNFTTKVRVGTETISHTVSLTNFAAPQLPGAITFSNLTTTTTNQLVGVQVTTTAASNQNLSVTTDYSYTNVPSATGSNSSTNAPFTITNFVFSVSGSTNQLTNSVTSNAPPTIQTVQTTMLTVSNLPATYYPSSGYYSNDTEVTTTTEQPMVISNYIYTIVITPDYVPDRANLFVLQPQLDWFHDDSVNIGVDGNGLLNTVTTSNVDETGGVIVALAQTAIQSFELAASGGLSGLGAVPAPEGAAHYAEISTNDDDNWATIARGMLARNRALDLGLSPTMRTNLQDALDKATGSDMGSAERDALREEVVDAVNSIIKRGMPLDPDEFRRAGVALRSQTQAVALLLDPTDSEHYDNTVKLLNRLLLEDAFRGDMEHIRSSRPLPSLNPPQSIDISFNPFVPEELAAAEDALMAGGLTIQNLASFSKVPEPYAEVSKSAKCSVGGIYYRPPMPYQISISDKQGDVISKSVLLPNKSPILHINFDKAPFVSTVSQVNMTNGFISSYAINKPSSALAIAQIPLVILSSITSSLTNLVQLKLNLATGQNSLASAALTQQSNQLISISNTIALLNAQQQLLKAQSPATTSSSGAGRGALPILRTNP
jgi:hypothetical protein